MKNLFNKHSRLLQVIGAILIVCMVVTDASLYNALVSGQDYEVVENHVLETALADGEYNGKNSDSESGQADTYLTTDAKRLFNVLEILPSESKGVIGYMISGCMPFENIEDIPDTTPGLYLATVSDLKDAYMDGLANKNPGKDNESKGTNGVYNDFLQLKEQLYVQGGIKPYDLVGDYYDGYYKYVGKNKGVFAYIGENNNNNEKDVEMVSRFYNYDSSKDYGYIFVYDQTSPNTARGDINVTHHKRVKCINNEKFIREYLGIGVNSLTEARAWRNAHECEVTTRSPKNLTLDDIEKADIIFIRDAGNDIYYQHAIPLNNMVNGRGSDYGKYEKFVDPNGNSYDQYGNIVGYKMANDIDDFEKVVKIYERVVVRKDAAIVVEKIPAFRTTGNITANIHKLIAMLFYVKEGANNDYGSGREYFTDFMKRYTSNPGTEYMKLRDEYDEHKKQNSSGKWIADPMYPDYRAKSLRQTEDKSDPRYYYMHYHLENDDGYVVHVGHPLVLDKENAITGGRFNANGDLEPLYYYNNTDENGAPRDLHPITLERYASNRNMFDDSSLGYKIDYKTDRYDSDGRQIYYHEGAYESMSNTTDFVYIDKDGNLVIDNKYSSNSPKYDENGNKVYSGYWFKIDWDGGINGQYACRRILWDKETFSKWPWDAELTRWLHKKRDTKDDTYDADLHMWFDYNYFKDYKTARLLALGTDTSENFGAVYPYENSCLVQENQLFKTKDENFIKNALDKRDLRREDVDSRHVDKKNLKDYYISMNVLNGDGFNKSAVVGQNNKTIYYNEYEIKRNLEGTITGYPNIPLVIRLKSTCPIVSISVVNLSSVPNKELAKYSFNKYDVDSKGTSVTGKCADKPDLTLISADADGKSTAATTKNTPIYEFSGQIPIDVVKDSKFYENRNTKLKVIMTVMLKDGKENSETPTTRAVEDTITIVRRDFFMLN